MNKDKRIFRSPKVFVFVVFGFLSGCGGPYADLEGSFKVDKTASAPTIPVKEVAMVSTHEVGAHSYHGVLTVKLTPRTIELEPQFPFNLLQKPLSIEAEKIAGCSKTCFGDGPWDADVLVASTGTEISFEGSKEVIEWCWSNQIPMISGNDRNQWLYSGTPLQGRSAYSEQLSSRELYDAQTKQSCLGY